MDSIKKSAGWALLLRGVLFMLFGFLVLFMESKTIYGPMNFLGIIFLVCGGLYLILSIVLRKTTRVWYFGVLWGILDLILGAYILLNMLQATDLYTDIIGIFALLMGISMLITAFFIKKFRIFLYINSIVSLSFGAIILLNPTIGRLDFLVGLYSLLFGMFVCYGGIWLMKKGKPEFIEVREENINK